MFVTLKIKSHSTNQKLLCVCENEELINLYIDNISDWSCSALVWYNVANSLAKYWNGSLMLMWSFYKGLCHVMIM
jgi:hypothetical protein